VFVGDDLVYLELPKTACTHVGRLLDSLPSVPGRLDRPKHGRFHPHTRAGAGDALSKLKLGTVRNPWDWYVSVWAFGCAGRGLVRRATAGKGAAESSAAAWRAVYADPFDPALFRRWLELSLVTRRADLPEGFDRSTFSRRVGFFTHRYFRLYTFDGSRAAIADDEGLARYDREYGVLDCFVKVERLEDDLIGALRTVGISDRDVERIRRRRPRRANRSRRDPDHRGYYDDAAAELVATADRYLIERHGYAFDQVPEPRLYTRRLPWLR